MGEYCRDAVRSVDDKEYTYDGTKGEIHSERVHYKRKVYGRKYLVSVDFRFETWRGATIGSIVFLPSPDELR